MGGLFSKPKIKIPKIEKPPVMVDEEALANTAKEAIKKKKASRGRASTVLTDRTEDRLGGGLQY